MFSSKGVAVLVFALCVFPNYVRGWNVCYWTCVPIVGAGEVGALYALGFTNAGIRAGSWAAKWMAGFKGSVPKGGWFSFFQSRGTRATSVFALACDICGYICDD
ncbi:hypothetical protein DPMN_086152 [Dreissena polymorpha]|uniref:Secreted protein n=1 Tax=Dreissena polymorpha TaxID=45954 RepID=A0A9D3YHB8_DREPO|nr:hypothetical protein DPMN_086152 [Dreissena polymorpha]